MSGGRTRRVQNAKGDCRSSLRTDQGTAQFSALQLAWQTECSPRVETGVRGQQPAEAVPGRLGSGNGIKRPEKEAVYRKLHRKLATRHKQDYCLGAPVRKPAL